MNGRQPILPRNTLLAKTLKYYGEDYVPAMLQELSTAFQNVREFTKESRERNKRLYDIRAKSKEFEAGDHVFCTDPSRKANTSQKLQTTWKNCYRIIAKKSEVNYRIMNDITS